MDEFDNAAEEIMFPTVEDLADWAADDRYWGGWDAEDAEDQLA